MELPHKFSLLNLFELVNIPILVLSLIPTILGLPKAKFGKKNPAAEDTAETADAE